MLDKSTEGKVSRGKFSERTIECVFVGYSTETKAFRLWDPNSKRIRRSRDVRFVKNFHGQDFKDFINEEDSELQNQNPNSVNEEEESFQNEYEFTLGNQNIEEANEREEDNASSVDEEPAVPRMKIGRGRPKKIRTGQRGRPRKQSHMVPIQEGTEEERNPEEQRQEVVQET